MIEARRSVLIVDDPPDGREMLAEYLTFRGFEVIEVNAEDALAQARTRRPAVVLMDLQMPGMGGWEATRQLKADPTTTISAVADALGEVLQRGRSGLVELDGLKPLPRKARKPRTVTAV